MSNKDLQRARILMEQTRFDLAILPLKAVLAAYPEHSDMLIIAAAKSMHSISSNLQSFQHLFFVI